MKLRVTVELTQEQLERLAGWATACGNYSRENPRLRWKQREYQEAARARIAQLALADAEGRL